MVFVYKTNITWTTPLVDYEPSSAWPQAVSNTNGTTASFKFFGNGVKWFGSGNASYAVQLNANGQPVGPQSRGQPRVYQPSAEIPANVACTNTDPWGCMVLAEFYNLTENVQYEVVLTTLFEGDTAGNKIDLLATQVWSNTTFPDRTVTQSTAVGVGDSRLTLAGDWENVTYDTNVYRVSKTPGSTITLPFKGYALRISGTTDLTTSSFSVSLDGTSYNVSTPTSNSPDNNCLFWFMAGLDQNKEHTAVITNTGSAGLIISRFDIDRLIDPLNPADGDGSSASPSATASATPGTGANTGATTGTSTKSSGVSTGAIAGIVVSVVALLFVILALFWWRRTKRKRQDQMEEMAQPAPLIPYPAPPLPPSQNQYQQNLTPTVSGNGSQILSPYSKHMANLAVPATAGIGGNAGAFLDGQRRPSSSSQQNTSSYDQITASMSPSSHSSHPQTSQTGSSSAYPNANMDVGVMSPTHTSVSGTQITSGASGNGDGITARSYTPPPAYEPQAGSSEARIRIQRPSPAEKTPSATSMGPTNR